MQLLLRILMPLSIPASLSNIGTERVVATAAIDVIIIAAFLIMPKSKHAFTTCTISVSSVKHITHIIPSINTGTEIPNTGINIGLSSGNSNAASNINANPISATPPTNPAIPPTAQ